MSEVNATGMLLLCVLGCALRVTIPSAHFSPQCMCYILAQADTLLVQLYRFPKASTTGRVEVEACVFLLCAVNIVYILN